MQDVGCSMCHKGSPQNLERLRQNLEAAGTARKSLADPNAYDLAALNEPQRKALIRFWEAWQGPPARLVARLRPRTHALGGREKPPEYLQNLPVDALCQV
jgi:hypothetical protein